MAFSFNLDRDRHSPLLCGLCDKATHVCRCATLPSAEQLALERAYHARQAQERVRPPQPLPQTSTCLRVQQGCWVALCCLPAWALPVPGSGRLHRPLQANSRTHRPIK